MKRIKYQYALHGIARSINIHDNVNRTAFHVFPITGIALFLFNVIWFNFFLATAYCKFSPPPPSRLTWSRLHFSLSITWKCYLYIKTKSVTFSIDWMMRWGEVAGLGMRKCALSCTSGEDVYVRDGNMYWFSFHHVNPGMEGEKMDSRNWKRKGIPPKEMLAWRMTFQTMIGQTMRRFVMPWVLFARFKNFFHSF